MGNLLTYNPSFDWSNYVLDRTDHINNLNLVFDQLHITKDVIYSTPDLLDVTFAWGQFFEFVWTVGIDYDTFKTRYDWIKPNTYQTLINILPRFKRPQSPNRASDLVTMNTYPFLDDNNGWIGFYIICNHLLVHDIDTWTEFHRIYVSTYAYRSKRKNYKYIKRFYNAQIHPFSVSQVKSKVLRKQAHPVFERLDDPTTVANKDTLHGEQIQMHFTDGSALNIDGSWKHRVGAAEIPSRALKQLEEWGFLLPPEYYT